MGQSPALSCSTTYNVTKYGAVGDNHTDNARAIQKAIDAAERNGYGCLYFPSGKYKTSGTASIPDIGSGFTIYGDGAASRIMATNDVDVIALPQGGHFFSVRDLYIGYDGPGTATRGAAVHTLNGTANFTYVRLVVEKTAYGLRIEQPNGANGGGGVNVIDQSRIHGMQTGVYSNSGVTITNSHIIGGTYGYVADGQQGGTRMIQVALFGALSLVMKNAIGRSGGDDSFYGYDVEANYERPKGAPFPSEGVGSAYIVGNNSEWHCVDCWMQDGTLIGSSQAGPTHATFTGGNFSSYPMSHYAGATNQITPHGLEIAYATRTNVTGGDYGSRQGDAIHLDPTSGSNLVTSNHITGRPVHGIYVGPTQSQNVQYNTIENWQVSAIATAGSMAPSSTIANNVLAKR